MLGSLAREINQVAIAKGFYDQPKSFIEAMYLIADEVHEAGAEWIRHRDENIPEELADVLIRLLDSWLYYCPDSDIDSTVRAKIEKNKGRERMHGKRI